MRPEPFHVVVGVVYEPTTDPLYSITVVIPPRVTVSISNVWRSAASWLIVTVPVVWTAPPNASLPKSSRLTLRDPPAPDTTVAVPVHALPAASVQLPVTVAV